MNSAPLSFGFDNSYQRLPERFFARVAPTPVRAPHLLLFNHALATELGLDSANILAHAHTLFSGNALPFDAKPIAMAYAGHQFGNFSPRLGDGRAILLGELRDHSGKLRDVQLKGCGTTPWSRQGDGRAWIGPVLREYLVSEAMSALGIPTTRALAAVASGETIYREDALPGAILTRVAASHIRVGTFEYFAARKDTEALGLLVAYVISRHYPELAAHEQPALAMLHAVMERQALLVARWLHVGFVHGVMNTDNMSISGETIDFGPCAFMDNYDPATVFSSIDHQGRYAFGNQPSIAAWNLARLAEALLPLLDASENDAFVRARQTLHAFPDLFTQHWLTGMRKKLGLATCETEDLALTGELLQAMSDTAADYTLTFRQLGESCRAGRRRRPVATGFPGTGGLVGALARAFAERRPDTRGARQPDAISQPSHHPTQSPRRRGFECRPKGRDGTLPAPSAGIAATL